MAHSRPRKGEFIADSSLNAAKSTRYAHISRSVAIVSIMEIGARGLVSSAHHIYYNTTTCDPIKRDERHERRATSIVRVAMCSTMAVALKERLLMMVGFQTAFNIPLSLDIHGNSWKCLR